MPNAVSVKLAGEWLYANRFNYPYPWRFTAARNILKTAQDYNDRFARGEKIAGAAIGATEFEPETLAYLERAAGLGIVHPMQAAEKVARRVFMLGKQHDDIREKLAMIATELKDETLVSPAKLRKLAEIIDGVDRETGLALHYADGVDMPEEMFFDILEKDAEAILDSHVTLTTGNSYPVGMLAQLPLEKLAEVIGQESIREVLGFDGQIDLPKLASVLASLPRPDAMLLERVMQEGIPTVKQAQALTKVARAPLMAKEPFTEESLREKLAKQGKKVETVDFTLQWKA